MLGILASKSRRALENDEPIREHLLLTRYSPERVARGEMLGVEDVQEILSLNLLSVIPDSKAVLNASNAGNPVILDSESDAGQAYADMVARYLGEERPMRFLEVERKGLFSRLFRG
jgi:septum site-determining protein MinD